MSSSIVGDVPRKRTRCLLGKLKFWSDLTTFDSTFLQFDYYPTVCSWNIQGVYSGIKNTLVAPSVSFESQA